MWVLEGHDPTSAQGHPLNYLGLPIPQQASLLTWGSVGAAEPPPPPPRRRLELFGCCK